MATAILFSPKPSPRIPFSPSTLNFPPTLISITNPRPHQHQCNHRFIPKIPFSSSFRNGRTPPETECPVPLDQQPINEYQALSTSFPFSWASGDFVEYCSRLFVTGASFALFVGLPVSWLGSVGPESEPLKLVLGAVSSGLFVVTLAVVRMYLGWAYVGNRLLSATVECNFPFWVYLIFVFSFEFWMIDGVIVSYMVTDEETGWYDGQIWVKTAEVLARDRLLGSFSVKPVLIRLKNTLVGLAASLLICVLLIINNESSQKDSYLTSGEPGGRSVPGVYNDDSARLFEPDAFCGEPGLP
ncbi:hypothetical protein F0562_011971 [Nyssa sinensis]|uniref:Uncharacterized protein n=1 Tax=Nyssa sinensis TaxID=561372 RepID=A0A5J4ZR27_9ASTE|nr:hypothetical protein F0562_011971 [Nyssa sinensis]